MLLVDVKFSPFALKDTVNKMQSTCLVRGDLTLEVGNLRLAQLVEHGANNARVVGLIPI